MLHMTRQRDGRDGGTGMVEDIGAWPRKAHGSSQWLRHWPRGGGAHRRTTKSRAEYGKGGSHRNTAICDLPHPPHTHSYVLRARAACVLNMFDRPLRAAAVSSMRQAAIRSRSLRSRADGRSPALRAKHGNERCSTVCLSVSSRKYIDSTVETSEFHDGHVVSSHTARIV
jgi:hypothetical protein